MNENSCRVLHLLRYVGTLAEDLFVVDSRIHDGSPADMRFILFAFLDGALMKIEILHSGEALNRLRHQISVRHGVANDHGPSTLAA